MMYQGLRDKSVEDRPDDSNKWTTRTGVEGQQDILLV